MDEADLRRSGIRGRPRARRTPFFVTILVLLVQAASAGAVGIIRHPSVEETVTGSRGILGPAFFSFDSTGTTRRPVIVQISEGLLYGIPGLHVSGVRLGASVAGVFLTAEAAQLSSQIGKETRLALASALWSARWAVSVGVVYDGVALSVLDGSNLISLTVRSLARVTDSFRVGGEVGGLRLSGEELPGADVTIVMTTTPARGVMLQGTVELSRNNGLLPGVATTIHGPGPSRFLMGFEGETDALKGAVAVRWGAVDLAAGVFYHPVLGDKTEITVTWFG